MVPNVHVRESVQMSSDTCKCPQTHAFVLRHMQMSSDTCKCPRTHASAAAYADACAAATLQRQAVINGLLHHGNCEGRAEAGRAAGKSLQPVDDLTCACLLYLTGLHAHLTL